MSIEGIFVNHQRCLPVVRSIMKFIINDVKLYIYEGCCFLFLKYLAYLLDKTKKKHFC